MTESKSNTDIKVVCSKCGIPKDQTPANYHSNGRDRFRSACKLCEHRRVANLRARGLCGGSGRARIARENKTPVPPQPIKTRVSSAKTYVVTWAQNATPVHEGFLDSLLSYCSHNDATLLVIPGRYQNPTSIWSDRMEHDEWWDSSLHDYLFNGRKELKTDVAIFGDVSIQPTASRPLTGFEVFVGAHSGIFGHPRLQFKTVATATRMPRILTTTGAVTIENYTSSKAGKKGEAHHVFGACVLEEDQGLFHIRQINAEHDGSFIELDTYYRPGCAPSPAPRALALVAGDIHDEERDQAVLNATLYDDDSIAHVLQPERIVYHDTLHFGRRGHHEIHKFKSRYDKLMAHDADGVSDSVHDEVQGAVSFIDTTPDFAEPVVIASNHDEHLDRWLDEAEIKKDPRNARFYHWLWAAILENREENKEWTPAFELCYEYMSENHRARFVRRNETYKVGDVYLNFHGDKGINGAKGTNEGYAKLGVKTIGGHIHSPSITDSAYVTGVTGGLDQGYNGLPSSWLNSHVIEYANSKRCIISVVGGRWRARRTR